MSVLVKPLVTEKVSALNEKGKYGFVVNLKANKVEIKEGRRKNVWSHCGRCQHNELPGQEKIQIYQIKDHYREIVIL